MLSKLVEPWITDGDKRAWGIDCCMKQKSRCKFLPWPGLNLGPSSLIMAANVNTWLPHNPSCREELYKCLIIIRYKGVMKTSFLSWAASQKAQLYLRTPKQVLYRSYRNLRVLTDYFCFSIFLPNQLDQLQQLLLLDIHLSVESIKCQYEMWAVTFRRPAGQRWKFEWTQLSG